MQIVSIEGQMVRPDQGHSQVKLVVDIGPRGLHFGETQVFLHTDQIAIYWLGGNGQIMYDYLTKSFLGQPPGFASHRGILLL